MRLSLWERFVSFRALCCSKGKTPLTPSIHSPVPLLHTIAHSLTVLVLRQSCQWK